MRKYRQVWGSEETFISTSLESLLGYKRELCVQMINNQDLGEKSLFQENLDISSQVIFDALLIGLPELSNKIQIPVKFKFQKISFLKICQYQIIQEYPVFYLVTLRTGHVAKSISKPAKTSCKPSIDTSLNNVNKFAWVSPG